MLSRRKGKGRVKEAELPHDYHQTMWHGSALGLIFFPFLPQKHSRSTSHCGTCPSVESQIKGENLASQTALLSHLWQWTLNARLFQHCAHVLSGKFLFTWLGGRWRENHTCKLVFLIYFSLSSSATLSLLAPARGCKQRRKKSNQNACAFQHVRCHLAQAAPEHHIKRKHDEEENFA